MANGKFVQCRISGCSKGMGHSILKEHYSAHVAAELAKKGKPVATGGRDVRRESMDAHRVSGGMRRRHHSGSHTVRF